jgi:methyl-accepting chemotaxis protein
MVNAYDGLRKRCFLSRQLRDAWCKIAAAVEEQASMTAELSRTVQDTSRNTEEVVRSIETLDASTLSSREAAESVSSARETLEQQLVRLQQDIELFLSAAKTA